MNPALPIRKILITYASAGRGHFKAAEGVYNYIKEFCPQVDLKIVDVLEHTNGLFGFCYRWSYSFLVRRANLLWQWAYWLTDFKAFRPFTRIIVTIVNRINTKALVKLLIKENSDFIISTHFLASEISAYLKITQRISSKLITIITDFGVHPFWICQGTDIYIVASTLTKHKLTLEGIKDEFIKVFGIPISPQFLKQYEKDPLYREFGLRPNKFTVLIATGSFGIGPIEQLVDLLYKDVQILVVCADNKRLHERLKNKNYPGVCVLGFIDNIPELMAVSDIIITKPGGLTITESLAMDLFPIFITAIPGQETENIRILSKYNLGIYVKDVPSIKNIILGFKNHPDKLKSAKANIYKIKRTNTLKEICNVVCQGGPGPSC